jgi:hypothetical protein
MIRKFKFEAEIYESLNCLPMAARRKLDAVGIKLDLAQWEQFGRGERLMICHAPADSEEEQSALRTFIEVALARTHSPANILSDDARRSANPPDHPPQLLVQHAGQDIGRWCARYQVPFKVNPHLRGDHSLTLRGALVAQEMNLEDQYNRAVFCAFWTDAVNVTDRGEVVRYLEVAGWMGTRF